MTVETVSFDSSGGSPLRISAAGVDVNGAEFSDLLFDANQQPLRMMQKGVVEMPIIAQGNIAPAVFYRVLLNKPTPPGRFALFCCVFNGVNVAIENRLVSPGWAGAGGAVSETSFFGVQWVRAIGPNPGSPSYARYMVFRNYG